ncbi:bystin-like [Corticium candelabrum]|uniref:bystin-like n=1 Tax=Corticium candelabrum TaxID=121492 RepID=UPI002E320EE0|nr:bystin-like [Corticium candelabrum]
MGKDKGVKRRHAGLADQLMQEDRVKPLKRAKPSQRKQEKNDSDFVEGKLSVRILDQARQQQDELEEEFGLCVSNKKKHRALLSGSSEADAAAISDDEDQDSTNEDDFYEHLEINEEDEKVLESFMPQEMTERKTLADAIMEKIRDKETELASHLSEISIVRGHSIDERVVHVYKGVGQILANYRSGKLPKAFKFIPSLANWEEVLHLTDPDKWTAASMYQGTRIFASNLNGKMAQRFYNLVLLPRIRDDIAEYKKLNPHLYMALKKALFKPAAFFKGILLPLCESGTCTLREAVIIGSVLSKTSIPVLHSAAALLKIAEMDYSGANSIFMRILLDKKYALPFRVVDAVVYHFLRFVGDSRTLPVLWHQCFLTFVQRYKLDISADQKEALLDVLKAHTHEKITPEIRREIVNSTSRSRKDDKVTMET